MKQINKVFLLFCILAVLVVALVSASKNDNNGHNKPPVATAPYVCGEDVCAGYRCVEGTSVSPACYNGAELTRKNCNKGEYQYIPQWDCSDQQYYYVWE